MADKVRTMSVAVRTHYSLSTFHVTEHNSCYSLEKPSLITLQFHFILRVLRVKNFVINLNLKPGTVKLKEKHDL